MRGIRAFPLVPPRAARPWSARGVRPLNLPRAPGGDQPSAWPRPEDLEPSSGKILWSSARDRVRDRPFTADSFGEDPFRESSRPGRAQSGAARTGLSRPTPPVLQANPLRSMRIGAKIERWGGSCRTSDQTLQWTCSPAAFGERSADPHHPSLHGRSAQDRNALVPSIQRPKHSKKRPPVPHLPLGPRGFRGFCLRGRTRRGNAGSSTDYSRSELRGLGAPTPGREPLLKGDLPSAEIPCHTAPTAFFFRKMSFGSSPRKSTRACARV